MPVRKGRLDEHTPADILKNFEIHAVAPLELTKQLLPLLKVSSAQKRRTVVANISSRGGSIADANYANRTSKTALYMISKSLSVDLKSDGIIVLALTPGWVQTDLGD